MRPRALDFRTSCWNWGSENRIWGELGSGLVVEMALSDSCDEGAGSSVLGSRSGIAVASSNVLVAGSTACASGSNVLIKLMRSS